LARLYADENFPNPTVEALRRLGHNVLTVADAGQAGLGVPDEDLLVFAHSDGRALLTHNRKHFRNLHRAGMPHSVWSSAQRIRTSIPWPLGSTRLCRTSSTWLDR
jgi:hypothetical protein